MATEKKNRLLDIFYRAIRGEKIKVSALAGEYEVSEKSISRDIAEIKNFLADSPEQFTGVEFLYDYAERAYRLLLNQLIQKELYHYQEVRHDCTSVIDNLWKLTGCINEQREITIRYYKMNRHQVERRIQPVAIMFSEYYFYLIAFRTDLKETLPLYFRIDRIVQIVEHRTTFVKERRHYFNEGELRKRIQFMQPGELRKIRFEFDGPSVQAILDKIPTAKVVGKNGRAQIIEAETYGRGINMFLLSQGHHVRPLAPQSFVEEMREEIKKMLERYR